ncbi:B-cell receptor CD22-like, partial [Sinocyclocheilus anshuiensis]|uniref:B-cell receptor CD22-like n=1 Tax=Sinocyclocheilus anshuiensis TaxID=1608454 RepID=UPI0007BA7DD3
MILRCFFNQHLLLCLSVKPEVKVTPDQRVFRGETVTLTCDIQRGGNIQWTYSWFKDDSVIRDVTERVYSITSDESYSGGYSSLPRSSLTATPNGPVFTGERVSLKCVINSDHSNWRYEWYKDSTKVSERHTVNTLTIERSETSDAGWYTCKGHIDGRSVSSHSSSVYLSVKDLPTSSLTVTPNSPVFTGERVSLTCEINSDHSNWRYEWYKYSTKVSKRHTVNTLTIERSETSDVGWYTCKGHIDGRSVSSHSSSPVYLSVKALPRSSLTATPNGPVFTGERVSLKCEINSDHSNWRYEWYKDSTKVSERHTVNTLTIERSETSDAGRYTCRGHIDGRSVSSHSSSVYLSVKDSPRSTLTVRPDSPVFTGETVNLKCVIESHSDWRWRNGLTYYQSSDWRYYQTYEWRYEWYKGRYSVMLQASKRYTVNRDTLTIRGVTTSDQDQYWCRGQRDKRPKSSHSSSVSLNVT